MRRAVIAFLLIVMPIQWADAAICAYCHDQRQGINAAKLRYDATPAIAVTAVIAQFEPHRTPVGPLPENIVRQADPTRAEWALKVDHTGTYDWSISYFDGYERFTRYTAVFTSPTSFAFQGSYERAKTLGADFATAVGPWTVRAEAAYSELSPGCGACGGQDRKVARAVFGADRDFGNSANLNAQVFGLRRSKYIDPLTLQGAQLAIAQGLDRLNSDFGRWEWGATLRLSNRFMNDRLKVDVSAIADFTNHSGVLRPRVSFAFSDTIRFGGGVDYFRGKTQSFFGNRKANDLAFVDMTLVF